MKSPGREVGTKPGLFGGSRELLVRTVLLFLFAVSLYGSTLWFGYTFDDRLVITENQFTRKGVAGIREILTTDSFAGFFGEKTSFLRGGRYRPLTQVMFALEYQVFGFSPFAGHFVNVLLYGLVVMAIYGVLVKLMQQDTGRAWHRSPSFIISVLFAVHPIHTEVVANIKGRDELMAALGAIGALYATLAFVDSKKTWHLLVSGACFFVGLMSKEHAITFLAVIPLAVYVFRDKRLKENLISWIPLLAASGIYVLIRVKTLGYLINTNLQENELLNNPFLGAGTAEKYATVVSVLGRYLRLLLLPHPLTHDYYPKHIPIVGWLDLRALVPLVVYAALAVFAAWGVKRKNIPAFGVAAYLATLSLSSNLFVNVGTFMNERFLFLPSFGYAVVVGFLLTDLLGENRKGTGSLRVVGGVALSAIVLFSSAKISTRVFAWKDDITLFTTDAATSSNSAKVNASAGSVLLEQSLQEGDAAARKKLLGTAAGYLRKSVEIYPEYVASWFLLGNAYLYLEDWGNSYSCYEKALALSPGFADALNNLQYVAQRTHKARLYQQSVKAYQKLVELQPANPAYLYGLAAAHDDGGSVETALGLLNALVARKPDHSQAYNRAGQIIGFKKNDLDSAVKYFQKAYALNPRDPSTLENLAVVYARLGARDGSRANTSESIRYYTELLAVEPANARVHVAIGNAYMNLGDTARAREYFARSVIVGPKGRAGETK